MNARRDFGHAALCSEPVRPEPDIQYINATIERLIGMGYREEVRELIVNQWIAEFAVHDLAQLRAAE